MGDCLYIEAGKDYEEGDEGSDISDSEINQYKEAVHKLLKFRTFKIRSPNGDFGCPFCVGLEKQGYNRLLQHSIRVAEGPTESGKQRASHLAMAKYLAIDLAADEKKKRDLRNNQMTEKLREAEENYGQLVEKLKKKMLGIEVALCNLEDIYQCSISKEQHGNEELERLRLELKKKDLRNDEMAEKLRVTEENYGGLVKTLESSLAALAEKNSMLESEVARAKEDASSKKSSGAFVFSSAAQKSCESPNPGISDSRRTKSGIKKKHMRNNQMAEKLREADEIYWGLVEKLKEKEIELSNLQDVHQRSVVKERQSNNELEEVRIELIKMDFRNNEMAEKLREAEERLKEKEAALSNLEDVYQHSKERQIDNELQEVRLELIKLLSDLTSHNNIDYSFGVKRIGGIDDKALKDACKKMFPSSVAELKLVELNNLICQAFEVIVDDKGNPQGLLIKHGDKLQGLQDELGEEIYNLLLASMFGRQKYLTSGSYMDPEMWNFKENRKATLKEVICYISSLLKGLLMRHADKIRGLHDELGEEIYNLLFASMFGRQKYLTSGSYMDPEMWNFKENRKATLKEVICYISSLLKAKTKIVSVNMRKGSCC